MSPIVIQIGDRDFVRKWQKDTPTLQLFEALEDIGRFIKSAAEARAPGRTKLAVDAGIEEVSGKRIQLAVGLKKKPSYAIFVHEGTGLFGEYKRPIFAGVGNVFSFESHGVRRFMSVTKGQHPQPFLWEAVALAEAAYLPFRVLELGTEIA